MRDSSTRSRLLLAGAASLILGAWGCGTEDGVLYVPGSGFREELHVISSGGRLLRAEVDEPIVLSAQRRSGPWRPVPASEVEDGQCAVSSMPMELEVEVADDVTWSVRPEGHATFGTDPRADRTREVRFDAPGRYIIWARSASPCGEPFGGDTIMVEIVE